jgi:esterase/lipase superfamily enzyme
MQKENWTWQSSRLAAPARVTRWGHYGVPVLLFPTAGGDHEEVERFHLVRALAPLIDAGRIKVFSVEGIAARTWLLGTRHADECLGAQSAYDAYIDQEVVPVIRQDLHSDVVEIIAAGAAFGARSAVSCLHRRPDIFRVALAMSGIFDFSRFLKSDSSPQARVRSPLHDLSTVDEGMRARRSRRFIHVATGEGDYEDPEDSRRLANELAAMGIPHRLDLWGRQFAHRWSTWHEMLPRCLRPHLP